MSRPAYTVFASEGAWQAARSGEAPERPTEPSARAVAEWLREHGYAGEGVLLALPSAWCLCASIATAGLPRRNRRQAMLFRLEEKLPLAAEDFVADFLIHPSDALGVAVPLARVAPIVADLESAGVAVEALCPAALVALARLLAGHAGPPPDAVLWADEHAADLFFLFEGRPAAWRLLDASLAGAREHLGLRLLHSTGPLRLLSVGASPAAAAPLAAMPDVELTPVESPPLATTAAAGAQPLLQGRPAPWINLRRDALAIKDRARQIRRPLRAAWACAVVFLAAAAAGSLWRAHAWEQAARQADEQARRLFHDLIPNQPTPLDVRRRMESEARKRQAVSGQGEPAPALPNALRVLHELLRRLNDDVRFRLTDLRIQGEAAVLDGATLSHASADRLAAGLRAANGFLVEPPRTKARSDGGVDFLLRATFPPASRPAEKRP